jgi:LPXTG-motif cell wall-anchored protein
LSANVPVFADITTKEKTIYYGGSISDNELLNGVTAGYKTAGTEEAGGVVSINEDGTLTPLEDWMDDYATITWNTYAGQNWTEAVGNIFGNAVSKVGTGRYAYAVTIAPREEATAKAGAAIPMEGVTDSADGIAYVLVPIVNFRNTVINRGYVPDQSYFENYNMVSVEWMEMNGFALESEGDDDPYTHPAPDYSLEPALYFTYQPIDPTFSADTGVNVSVFSSNDNAEEGIYVANGTVFGDLVATMDADDSDGAFTILVEYIAPFELPETGGMGTAGFRTIGLVLLMCAVVLVRKKERNVE